MNGTKKSGRLQQGTLPFSAGETNYSTTFTRFGAFVHGSVYTLGDQNVFMQNFYILTICVLKTLLLTLIF